MKSLIDYVKRDKINIILFLITFTFFIVIMAIFAGGFFTRFAVELEEGFKNDGTMYCTVGRGIVYGYKPYVDFFETKGPVLFYMCALSFLISGDNSYYAMNVFSFICLIFIMLSPIIFITIRFVKKKERNYLRFFTTVLATLTFSLLLASYAQFAAGRVMAEMYCCFFLLIAIFILYFIDSKKLKIYSPTIIISGLFIFLAVLSKETFAFVGVVAVLFICRSKRDLLYKFVIPFSYGVIFAFIFLAATSTLVPYFSIYVKSMLSIYLPSPSKGFSTMPFILKMINIPNVIVHFWEYSPTLTFLVIGEYLLFFYFVWKNILFSEPTLTAKRVLLCFYYSLSFLFILPFVLALGDLSFNHQHISGLPIYYLMLFYLIDQISFTQQLSIQTNKIKQPINIIGISTILISCLGICLLPQFTYSSSTYRKKLNDNKECAAYVDQVLDTLHEDTYQHIGDFACQFYPYTTHLPLGPCFFQTDPMIPSEDSYFGIKLKAQIESVNVVINTGWHCGALEDWIIDYLNKNFTTKEPESIKDIKKPTILKYVSTIYYRK